MRRYDSLDSIRGFASVAVMFGHMLLCLPVFYSVIYSENIKSTFAQILSFSPLHLFWGGHEAVILFFVLSGFVLSLPYLNGSKLVYGHYIIKRFFRIYIPYILIIAISISLKSFLYSPDGIVGLSKWFNWMWMLPVDSKMLFNLIFMTGDSTHNIDTVAWSLGHEIRISLIFPFIALLIKRMNFTQIIIFINLLIIDYSIVPRNFPFHLHETFYYLVFFVFGAFLAKYRNRLGEILHQKTSLMKGFLFIFALILYNWHWNLGLFITKDNSLWAIFNTTEIVDFSAAIGASIFFMFAIHSKIVEKILTYRVSIFMGKISYSLYLIHPVVLLTLLYTLKSILDPKVIILFVPLVSILLAGLYYRFVELPSMKLGKSIVSKLKEEVRYLSQDKKSA